MKLTKKIEAEIKYAMNDYWESYLNGNLDHWASYLVNDYKNIGTTEAEIWKSKKEIYDYSVSVLDQMVGFTELRNKKTEIIPYDPYLMVHEYLDLYIKVEEKWIFYSKLRLSSLIQKIDNTWKILHQHGSYPDSKVMDGEFFAFDTLKSENLKLQKAIKKRTLELENKNRVLEIEGALEKVRSAALVMKDPADMVDVCNVISDQLQFLGVKDVRNVQTVIINEQNSSYLNYQYFAAYKQGVVEETDYNKHPTVLEMVKEMKKSANSTFSGIMNGKELTTFREWRKQNNQFPDPILDAIDSAYYYFSSIGLGGLGLTTYKPLSKEELEIFKRFHNVFTLAYRRFFDIEKAIAQAREAKVEAALERIRSIALGMRKSEEVGNVTDRLFAELINLSIDLNGASIVVIDEDTDKMELWRARSNIAVKPFESTSFTESMDILKKYLPDWFPKFFTALGKRKNYLIDELSADRRLQFINAIADQYKYSKEEKSQLLKNAPINITTHFIFFKLGYLALLGERKLSTENLSIIRRFVEVFDFSYTRFLDLQNAERQVREAQIESSLERVRSVAMSMMKSDELLKVCEAVFNELRLLGFNETDLRNTQIVINNDEKEIYNGYQYSDYTGGEIAEVPYDMHPIIRMLNNKLKQSTDAFADIEISGEAMDDWKDFVKSFPQKPDEKLNAASELHYYFYSVGIGALGISSFKSLSEDKLQILQRLRNVFNLSYQRYVDISKSEAQARESQIELALEKVRARTMGMQKSDELKEVIQVVYDQFVQLNINIEHTGFIMDYKARGDMHIWLADKNGPLSEITIPYFDSPHWNSFNEAKEKGSNFFANNLNFKEKNKFYRKLFKYIPDLPEEARDFYFSCQGLSISTVLLDNVGLYIENFSGIPYSDEDNNSLMRFGKVFQQTYTRFLDLQKAEEQARQAQIETAMEKVRARALAMQHSDELAEASFLLDSQVRALGIKTRGCAFNIYGENESTEWFSSEKGTLPVYQTPKENIFLRYFEEGQKGVPMYIESFEGPACAAHYDYLCTLPIMGEALTKFKEEGGSFPNKQIDHVTYFKYGYLLFITLEPVPDAHDIFKRFTKVFEQTYTRFLDLKKAEAQARESQIEAGLERARAQSMMMQHSEELNKTSQVFHEQLRLLGIESEFSYLWLPDEVKYEHLFWTTWQEAEEGSVCFKNKQVIYPLDKSEPAIAECYVAWESGMPVHVNPVPATGVEEYFNTWSELLEGVDKFKPELYPDGLYYVDAYMKYGCFGIMIRKQLSEDEQQVLHRFSREFERAFTRFLDLKKTEAQAREAQIELSLERIRAQVTAMKESVDLLDIVVTMRTEFVNLGHEAHYFWHMRYLPNKYEKAMTSGDGTRIGMVMTLPRHIHGDIKLIDDWEKSDEPTVVFAMDVETAVDYVDKMISLGDFQQVDPNAPTLDDIRHIGGLTFVMARTSHGEIGYSLPGVVPDPPEEDLAILFRFAGVFDLAYKRFEDLKISEQRNREARIELALERVRARTMAMQKSNELAQTAAHLFSQLNELGIKPYRCNIAIVDEDLKNCRLWSTTNSGNVIPTGSALPLNEHPILQETYDGWKTQKPNHIIKLAGTERLEWTRYISKYLPFEEYKKNNINEDELIRETAFLTNLFFKQGFFTIQSKEELAEDQVKIIQRFAYVFEQTYTRFLDLENAEKQNKIIQAENERKTEELEEARQLQLAMLPKEVPQLSNLDIAVFMKTATEVGGDYYDFHVDSKNNLTAIIGDATGHGMKAGTMVTITKSLFNTFASSRDILNTFKRISEVIKNMKFRQLSMCLQMIKINGSELSISSAAMPPAFIYRLNEDCVEEILLSGMPLGAMLNYQYKIEKRILNKGDVIFLLSDGLPELHNNEKHMYGYDRIKTELKKVGKKSTQKIVKHFEQSAKEWLNGFEQDDDITFVVIKAK